MTSHAFTKLQLDSCGFHREHTQVSVFCLINNAILYPGMEQDFLIIVATLMPSGKSGTIASSLTFSITLIVFMGRITRIDNL